MSAPTLSSRTSNPPSNPPSPAAIRSPRPGWRDPRLAAGIALVSLCALIGARLLGNADDKVAVWALRSDAVAGRALGPGSLVAVEVGFTSADDADRYVSADDALPSGTVLLRRVGEGELLPREALGSADELDLVEVPVTLPSDAVPATLEAGSSVDLWVTGQDSERSVLVFEGVPVLALPSEGSSLSPSGERQVVLGLDEAAQEALPEALARLAHGTAVLVRRAGR